VNKVTIPANTMIMPIMVEILKVMGIVVRKFDWKEERRFF
jgi:hypothetical protein